MNSGNDNPGERREFIELRGDREDGRTGRRFLSQALTRFGWEDRADDATLLLSELLANVALHARTPCSVTVVATSDRMRVEVEDGSPILPRLQHFAIDTTTGRGLRLVDQLAESWGVDRVPAGKRIWFCLEHEDSAAMLSARRGVSDAAGESGQRAKGPEGLIGEWPDWEDDPASLMSTMGSYR